MRKLFCCPGGAARSSPLVVSAGTIHPEKTVVSKNSILPGMHALSSGCVDGESAGF